MMGYQGYKWNINSLVSNHDFFRLERICVICICSFKKSGQILYLMILQCILCTVYGVLQTIHNIREWIGLNTVRLIVIIFLVSVKKSHVFNLITWFVAFNEHQSWQCPAYSFHIYTGVYIIIDNALMPKPIYGGFSVCSITSSFLYWDYTSVHVRCGRNFSARRFTASSR